jgi:hypothetical protein
MQAYYLRIKWTALTGPDNADNVGYSYSKLFGKSAPGTKVSEDNFRREWNDVELFQTFTNSDGETLPIKISADEGGEYRPQALQSVLDQAAATEGSNESPRSTLAATATTPPTATPLTDPRGGAGDTSDATPTSAPSSGGGLSQGAIIGIGVAAGIIGLLAIGLLVWFFCLRNRRRHGTKDHGPYAAPDHQASEYMVNKETTGAHVTESPHSPYSDDGSLAHQQGQGSSLAQVQQQQQTNQYSDAPPITAPVPRSAAQQASDRPGSASGTRSGTPGGGHNVSHLIEEGMTEADIRRLEEEERALDDAIERAGHGRR